MLLTASVQYLLYCIQMNQNPASTPATKADLIELEKKFEKKFATKLELKAEIQGLAIQMDIKMDRLEQRMDDKMRGYRDDVLNKLDGIVKELETARQERIAANHQIQLALDKLYNHEQRIQKLEGAHN